MGSGAHSNAQQSMSLHPCGKCCQFLLKPLPALESHQTSSPCGHGQALAACPCQHPWPSTDIAWALGLCSCCHQPLSPSCHCVHLCRTRHGCPSTVPKYLCFSPCPPAQEVIEGRLPHHFSVCPLDPRGTGVGENGRVFSEPAWDRSQPVLLEPLIHFFRELGKMPAQSQAVVPSVSVL